MTLRLFTPRASRELRAAAEWIAEDSPQTAEAMLVAVLDAAARVTQRPMLARVELKLAPARYRFWSLRGYPYLLVIDSQSEPPVIARFVHQARDLPVILDDL